ncbi:MAG: anti-sigma factor family protein [Rhodospirillales bacterium]
MHPDITTLLAYRDRQLEDVAQHKIQLHVAGCARCAAKLERLSKEWDHILAADSALRRLCAPPPDGLARVLSAIRERAARSTESELKQKVVEQLEVYFGSRIWAVLGGGPASEQGTDLLAKAEPLLTTFIGRRAAAAVVAEIHKGVDPGACLNAGVM